MTQPQPPARADGPRVLQVGMDPGVIDFSPWPGQSADALRGRIDAAAAELRAAGFDVSACLLPDDADRAEAALRASLSEGRFDVIEVGSGVRTSHEYTLIFERAMNTIIACQPGVPLCFNDSPETTLDAVRRALVR